MANINCNFSVSTKFELDSIQCSEGEMLLHIWGNSDSVIIMFNKSQMEMLKKFINNDVEFDEKCAGFDYDLCDEDEYGDDLDDVGDCDLNNDECSDEDNEYEYHVNRDWQSDFIEHLYSMGFDGYGIAKTKELSNKYVLVESSISQPTRKFENEIFSIMPFYWGDDDEISKLPNFHYKPTGFKMQWYKYALRSSFMNQDLSWDELEKILQHCKRSTESN